MSEVYDKKINTWPFPYHPGYHPSTASRADMGVSGWYPGCCGKGNVLISILHIILSIMFKIIVIYIFMLFHQYIHVWGFAFLLTCGKHLYVCIISLKGDIWAHKTSLTPPFFIEAPAPSQESKRWCIDVFGVSICLFLPCWYLILELFRQSDAFSSFYKCLCRLNQPVCKTWNWIVSEKYVFQMGANEHLE